MRKIDPTLATLRLVLATDTKLGGVNIDQLAQRLHFRGVRVTRVVAKTKAAR